LKNEYESRLREKERLIEQLTFRIKVLEDGLAVYGISEEDIVEVLRA
jgi:hypothetical protein